MSIEATEPSTGVRVSVTVERDAISVRCVRCESMLLDLASTLEHAFSMPKMTAEACAEHAVISPQCAGVLPDQVRR